MAEAKAFRDMEHRLGALMRKQFGCTLTAADKVEKTELGALVSKRAAQFVCPPGYGPDDAMTDSNRLHQLNCKRLRPPSCGGGELKGAEDEEEAFLTARVAAFWHSPEGRDRKRMRELEFKGIGSRCRTLDEQQELDQLTLLYPEPPRESELATAIKFSWLNCEKSGNCDQPIIRGSISRMIRPIHWPPPLNSEQRGAVEHGIGAAGFPSPLLVIAAILPQRFFAHGPTPSSEAGGAWEPALSGKPFVPAVRLSSL